jgi:hypothetical protein
VVTTGDATPWRSAKIWGLQLPLEVQCLVIRSHEFSASRIQRRHNLLRFSVNAFAFGPIAQIVCPNFLRFFNTLEFSVDPDFESDGMFFHFV